MKFMLCGKELCLPLWLTILSVSSSRFYEVRKEYLNGKSNCAAPKKVRSISALGLPVFSSESVINVLIKTESFCLPVSQNSPSTIN